MPANLQEAFDESDDLPEKAAEHQVADVEQGEDPSPEALAREPEPKATEEAAEEPAEDERLAEGGEVEEEGAEESQPEEKRKRSARDRRDARKRHMLALEESNDLLRREVEQLKQGFYSLQGNSLQTQLNVVDARLSECLNDIDQAESFWVAAHGANNGADMLKAQKVAEEARSRAGNLKAERERLASELTQQRTQPAPQLPVPGDPIVSAHAARFRADKPWIQFGAGNRPANQETLTAMLLDGALKREGKLSEREPGYWKELDKRMRAAMPHVFNEPTDDEEDEEEVEQSRVPASNRPPARKGPAVGSSGRNGSAGRGETHIPPHVVEAIKEAGFWEDPKERADALKYFRGAK